MAKGKQYIVNEGWSSAGPYAGGEVFEESKDNEAQIPHWLKLGAIIEYEGEEVETESEAVPQSSPALAVGDAHADPALTGEHDKKGK